MRYAGQPIAAVAAISPNVAGEAAALVKVQYDVMPFVVDLDKARAADAPLVYPGAADQGGTAGGGGGPHGVAQTGNVHGPSIARLRIPSRVSRDADVVVEGHYVTQVQTHSALETHGVVADWKPEMLTVWASTQAFPACARNLQDSSRFP